MRKNITLRLLRFPAHKYTYYCACYAVLGVDGIEVEWNYSITALKKCVKAGSHHVFTDLEHMHFSVFGNI